MKISTTLAFALTTALALSGCGSTKLPPVEVAPAKPEAAAASPAQPAAATTTVTPIAATPMPTPAPSASASTLPAHLDAKSAISTQRSVYFDFDAYTVKSEYSPLVERQGAYLLQHPPLAIRVEGHTDERGSTEYNLALGQRRAEAVMRALKAYGVSDGRMEAVSFGKDKPKSEGHDEAAWAENRRADIVYPTK